MAYKVDVNFNLNTEFLAQAKKHSSTSHGMSMIALSMLDINHTNLKMTMTFDSLETLENCAEQMAAVWAKCESNKVLFRSVQQEEEFLNEYFERQLTNVTAFPTASAEYKNCKVILDIKLGYTHTYTFYRWNEQHPRVLTLQHV